MAIGSCYKVANDLGQQFSTVGVSIEVYEDPNKAVADADIIYAEESIQKTKDVKQTHYHC
ncbi:MAG: hypothetical protein DHS20C20_08170 [Ardenticatenaceae bacterium]|nr:MAG: hypothetical protein DHS20C20_08170 [Ardenticatenaceae bacterium]